MPDSSETGATTIQDDEGFFMIPSPFLIDD
jgi:hypothetical protein